MDRFPQHILLQLQGFRAHTVAIFPPDDLWMRPAGCVALKNLLLHGERNHLGRTVLQLFTGRRRGQWEKMQKATVALPGVSLQLQQLQLASGGQHIRQQGGQGIALKIEIDEECGVLKKASTKVVESVEGKVKAS